MAPLIISESAVSPEHLQERLQKLDDMEAMCNSQIQWYECKTPAEYRKMRLEGTNGFPKPVFSPAARTFTIPARDGHLIELRVIAPADASKGTFLHFHAGGFVIGSNKSYDPYLGELANALSMTVASVEYRLAPEHPFPTGPLDCLDAALFALSAKGEKELGGSLKIMGGESAGGYLTVWVALALRDDHGVDVRSKIDALLPTFGIFDLTYSPSVLSHKRNILLGKDGTERFMEAAFSKIPMAQRKDPKISPLFADLTGMPPAMFLVGTVDPLVDDTVFMASKWSSAGNVTEVRLITAGFHAFTLFPLGEITNEGRSEMINFVKQNMR